MTASMSMYGPIVENGEGADTPSEARHGAPRPPAERRIRDWVLSHVLLGAIIVTAISTTVSILVTHIFAPNTEAIFAAFRMAQDARIQFDQEMAILVKTREGAKSKIYLHLIRLRSTADAAYGHEEWRKAEATYAHLTYELDNACTTGSLFRSLRYAKLPLPSRLARRPRCRQSRQGRPREPSRRHQSILSTHSRTITRHLARDPP
jgi:hypothetical protein